MNRPSSSTSLSKTSFAFEFQQTRRLALPLILAQAASMLMGIVDTAVVSRFSASDAAGASLGNALTMSIAVFGMGIAMALEPLVAQARGSGDERRAWGWWKIGKRVSLLAGIPTVFLTYLAGYLIGFTEIEPETHAVAMAYILARTPSTILLLGWLTARSFLQSYQSTRPLLWAALFANIINLVVDLLVVDGLVVWGGAGAGVATSFSMAVLFFVTVRGTKQHRPKEGGTIREGDVKKLIHLAFPLSLQTAAEMLIFSVTGVIATTIGDIEGNAHQIALNCASLTFMLALGTGSATASRVGEAVGKNDLLGVRHRSHAGLLLGTMVMTLSALMFATLAPQIISLFDPKEARVFELAVELLYIAAFFQFFDGIQAVMSGILRGLGDIRFPFVLTTTSYWAVGFPVSLFLAFQMELGIHGLWYGLTSGLMTSSVLLLLRYAFLQKRGLKMLEDHEVATQDGR